MGFRRIPRRVIGAVIIAVITLILIISVIVFLAHALVPILVSNYNTNNH
jgi:hypothetical protein